MIVLHAAFCDRTLLLWGETSEKRGLRTAIGAARNPLAAAVSTIAPELNFPPRAAREAVAWLPTMENRPIPSSGLIADQPVSAASAYIAPWVASVLPIEPRDLTVLLPACLGKRVLSPGIVLGDDLAYWARAFRVAASLVARGQFLPGLTFAADRAEARWKPAFPQSEAALRHELIE
ncbi:MAG: hypothetical protein ACR2I2_12155, partial [Bryobacteraceae bacterium]